MQNHFQAGAPKGKTEQRSGDTMVHDIHNQTLCFYSVPIKKSSISLTSMPSLSTAQSSAPATWLFLTCHKDAPSLMPAEI